MNDSLNQCRQLHFCATRVADGLASRYTTQSIGSARVRYPSRQDNRRHAQLTYDVRRILLIHNHSNLIGNIALSVSRLTVRDYIHPDRTGRANRANHNKTTPKNKLPIEFRLFTDLQAPNNIYISLPVMGSFSNIQQGIFCALRIYFPL